MAKKLPLRAQRKLHQELDSLMAGRDYDTALKKARRGLAKMPRDPQLRHIAGVAACYLAEATPARRHKTLDQAIADLRRAVDLAPTWFHARMSLGHACQARDRPLEAERAFVAAAELAGNNLEAQTAAANALSLMGATKPAVRFFENLHRRAPKKHGLMLVLSRLYQEQGEPTRAQDAIDKALAMAPDNADYHFQRANLLSQSGAFVSALEAVRRALKFNPNHNTARLLLSNLARGAETAAEVQALEARTTDPSFHPKVRICSHFALAGYYDRLGRHEDAFAQWVTANRLYAPTLPDQTLADQAYLDATRAAIPDNFVAAASRETPAADAPVFVIGLPRSGTTLVERILDRHPEVTAAGERTDLLTACVRTAERFAAAAPLPEGFATFEETAWPALAADYLRHARPHGAARFIDKSPLNAVYLPILLRAFPTASIVYCRRDPFDTGLSLFQQFFEAPISFCYDLQTLGRYIAAFEAFMDHWRNLIPGRVVTVDYEDLVHNPATAIPALIEAAGLEWHADCATYHQGGTIRTASVWQARQPIYTTSTGRWRRFENQLTPMIDAYNATKSSLRPG